MHTKYPEIKKLETIQVNFDISTRAVPGKKLQGKDYYPAVQLKIAGKSYDLYVDDEHHDLEIKNPLLSLCLVLKEFEKYEEEQPYEHWCKTSFLDPLNEEVVKYYQQLKIIYQEVINVLGEIDSCVSDFDFELNAGAAQFLRASPGRENDQ